MTVCSFFRLIDFDVGTGMYAVLYDTLLFYFNFVIIET